MAYDKWEFLDIIVDCLLAFSISGALGTIITFSIFKDIRTYPIKLIIYLCVCIFLSQTFFWLAFWDQIYDSKGCVPVAFIYHYFFLASFFWAFSIAFNFYQMIVRRNRDAEALEKWYHLVCWIAPMIVCVIVVSTESYGVIGSGSGQVCYMKTGTAVFLAFFLPGLILVSANAVIFFFIAREVALPLSLLLLCLFSRLWSCLPPFPPGLSLLTQPRSTTRWPLRPSQTRARSGRSSVSTSPSSSPSVSLGFSVLSW